MDKVQVALRIRPLVQAEIDNGSQSCIERVPNEPQIIIGKDKKSFTFNFVFDEHDDQFTVYRNTVQNLVGYLFKGYNVTVVAYGQTGSGKTYTMGTDYETYESGQGGIIPQALQEIFDHNSLSNDQTSVAVSFVELYNENLYDLLTNKGREQSVVDLRDSGSGVFIPGLTQVKVNTVKEALQQLVLGSQGRMTGATAMNLVSSRSHAIFTVGIKIVPDDNPKGAIISKFHLVDLAGSERPKKTGAKGDRFKEGININMGLFMLGNVISQLGEGAQFITYRDSKLTRLLQDSLGGNSVTLIIACVSPADYNYEETLSTLRYADRARKIKNKPVINQDPATAEISRLKTENEELKLRILSSLSCPSNCIHEKRLNDALKQNELLVKNFDIALVQSTANLYEKEIWRKEDDHQLLEALDAGNKESESEKSNFDDDDLSKSSKEHIINQSKLSERIQLISMRLIEKQQLVEQLLGTAGGNVDSPSSGIEELRKQLQNVTSEKESLKSEIENVSSHAEAATAKVSEMRRQKLIDLEHKHSALLKKFTEQQRIIKIKEKSDEKILNLKNEITSMKQMKVKLIKQLQTESEKFRSWRIMQERQISRLQHENSKHQLHIHKMERKLTQQQIVLQRKLAAAVAANKRIKETLERQSQYQKKQKTPLKIDEYIAHELEIVESVIHARKSLDTMIQDRALLSKEINKLKEELKDKMLAVERRQELESASKNLKEELDLRTTQIADLQQKLADSRIDEKKNRWDSIQSMNDAKLVISSLFSSITDAKKNEYNLEQLVAEVKDLLEESLMKNDSYSKIIEELQQKNHTLLTQIEKEKREQQSEGQKMGLSSSQDLPTKRKYFTDDEKPKGYESAASSESPRKRRIRFADEVESKEIPTTSETPRKKKIHFADEVKSKEQHGLLASTSATRRKRRIHFADEVEAKEHEIGQSLDPETFSKKSTILLHERDSKDSDSGQSLNPETPSKKSTILLHEGESKESTDPSSIVETQVKSKGAIYPSNNPDTPKRRYRYFPDEDEPDSCEYRKSDSSERKREFFTEADSSKHDVSDFQEQFKSFITKSIDPSGKKRGLKRRSEPTSGEKSVKDKKTHKDSEQTTDSKPTEEESEEIGKLMKSKKTEGDTPTN